MQIIKTAGVVVGTTLFLTITLNEKTLFSYIYKAISPATVATQRLTVNLASSTYNSVHSYTKKLFENSVPNIRKDTLKLRQSSIVQVAEEPLDEIDDEDKEQLDDLIKSN